MKRRKKLPYVIIILACIFLLIPFAATLIYSFTIGWTKLFPAGWTFKYWIQAFTEPTLWPAILRGVLISIPPILICNIVVILGLYTSVVFYPRLEKYIQTICMIPNSLQGVTIAIPVLALYAGGVTITEPKYEVSDVNLDGTVDVNDVTYMQMHLAGYKIADGSAMIDTANMFRIAESNGDGELDVNDVTHIQMMLAGLV